MIERRLFLQNLGAVGCGHALLPLGTLGVSAADRATTPQTPMTRRIDPEVAAFVAKLGTVEAVERVHGSPTAASPRTAKATYRVCVRAVDAERLSRGLTPPGGLPFDPVYAQGNTLCFLRQDTAYEVECRLVG